MASSMINRLVQYGMLVLGFITLLGSAFYTSYVLAFIGLGLTFWGALFLYVTSSKYVKLELLNAAASSTLMKIERVLSSVEGGLIGVYLPPNRLEDYTSSLVFIPIKPEQPLPRPEETDPQTRHSQNLDGLFITPPGLALSKLFEKELKKPFTLASLKGIQEELPRIFKELQITNNTTIQTKEDTVTVEMTDNIFAELCQETGKLKKTHETVGCPLSSAIACALAKATGKPVTIQEDTPTRIRYRILED